MNSIKLLVYDFDGVMTDNKVFVDQHGNEMVQVSRADGLGIAEIRKLGIQQMILSTETHMVVSACAKKLDLFCFQGVENKAKALSANQSFFMMIMVSSVHYWIMSLKY